MPWAASILVGVANVTTSDLASLRVLIPTPRREYHLVSYGAPMDFEDAAADASDADFVHVPLRSRRRMLSSTLRGHPPRRVQAPRQRYDVCFFVAMAPYWIPSLDYVRDLKRVANRVVVYLLDSWLDDIPRLKRVGSGLDLVDHLVVSFEHARDSYAASLQCKVHYLPQAMDERWFHPYRDARPIDILSVGRRLPEVHRYLLEYARSRDLFYFFQEARRPEAINIRESQELIGRICQSARVHVNWSVAATKPERAGEGDAITGRWFEAAACAGHVVGEAPRSQEFARLFPYHDFVHPIDPTRPDEVQSVVEASLAGRDSNARRELAEHVRSTHTWKVRWREIMALCEV